MCRCVTFGGVVRSVTLYTKSVRPFLKASFFSRFDWDPNTEATGGVLPRELRYVSAVLFAAAAV